MCFRNLFGHIEIGVLLAGSGFHFVDANPTACRMLGYSRDEMSRLNASDVVLPAGAGHVPPASTGAENAIFHCQAQSFRRSDGSIFSAETLSIGFPDGSLLRIFREIGRIQASSESSRRHRRFIPRRDCREGSGRDREELERPSPKHFRLPRRRDYRNPCCPRFRTTGRMKKMSFWAGCGGANASIIWKQSGQRKTAG